MKPLSILARAGILIIAFSACGRPGPQVSGRLPQRGYIWQRDWTPAVIESFREAETHLDGVVLLDAEITFTGQKVEVVRASIDWEILKQQGKPFSVAVRVAPFPGPFRPDDTAARALVDLTKSLLDEARAHNVKLEEFQLDFDCAQKSLGNYRVWLRMLRPIVGPTRFVITTLPAWLDESEFVPLVREVDGYVLQVHSVPISAGRVATLCDTRLARQWVAKAAKLRMPFSVALPTYRCTAGYGPNGKLLGVAMDSVQPSWPPNTRVLEFASDADDIATLVNEWQTARPAELRELLWYRVPVVTDTRNWRWVTLSAVMAGRKPLHRLNVLQEGVNPVDLSIANAGEADELLDSTVTATWSGGALIAADALAGWRVRSENGRAVFSATAGHRIRLSPGTTRRIGWLRYDAPINLQLKLSKQNEASR